jgi:hypothetical protein
LRKFPLKPGQTFSVPFCIFDLYVFAFSFSLL